MTNKDSRLNLSMEDLIILLVTSVYQTIAIKHQKQKNLTTNRIICQQSTKVQLKRDKILVPIIGEATLLATILMAIKTQISKQWRH